MAEKDEELVRLQVNVRATVRRKLKAVAVEQDLEMGDIADAILDHILPLLTTGKAPAAIVAAIEKAKKARKADDSGA